MANKPIASDASGKPIAVGDFVRVEKIPDSLLQGLPADEQDELRACVGQTLKVEDIDERGNVWIGFGATKEGYDEARYSGHSFALESFNVTLVR